MGVGGMVTLSQTIHKHGQHNHLHQLSLQSPSTTTGNTGKTHYFFKVISPPPPPLSPCTQVVGEGLLDVFLRIKLKLRARVL